jgi:6,7-dimethyl-8-ribityllumazine synthase
MSSDPYHPGQELLDGIPLNLNASVGIVVSERNPEITERLLHDAVNTLKKYGLQDEDIFIARVPGATELIFGARQMAIIKEPSAVIVLAAVVQDETLHFEYTCRGVIQGITELNLHNDIPFISGVMMTENRQQANELMESTPISKGEEAAKSALKMVNMVATLVNS